MGENIRDFIRTNTRRRDIIVQQLYSFVGAVCAYGLRNTRITPNQITVLGFITGALAAAMFLKQEYPYLIIGALLIQISLITDYIDGVLARYKGRSSLYGAWLDFGIDRFVDVLVILGATLGVYWIKRDYTIFIYGYGAIAARLLINLTQYSFKLQVPQGETIIEETQKRSLIKEFLFTRAFIHILTSICAVFNIMGAYIVFLCVYALIFWIGMFIYCGVRIKKLIQQGVIK